jgi:hypothetical protein
MKSTLFGAITAFGLVIATPVFATTTDQVPQTGGFWSNYQNSAHFGYRHGYTKTANAELNVENRQKTANAEMNVDNQQKAA